jgi:hypothetical protein
MKRTALLLAWLAMLLVVAAAPAEARQKIRGTYTGKIRPRFNPRVHSWRVTLKVGTLHQLDPSVPLDQQPSSGRVRFRRGHRRCSGPIYYSKSGEGYSFETDLHGAAAGPCPRPGPRGSPLLFLGRRLFGLGSRLRHGIYLWEDDPGERYGPWVAKLRHLH